MSKGGLFVYAFKCLFTVVTSLNYTYITAVVLDRAVIKFRNLWPNPFLP